MADNKRWFKVWNSVLTDPSFMITPLESLSRWMLLGAVISLHGKNGVLEIEEASLKTLLRMPEGLEYDNALPMKNICLKRSNCDNGKITVTMKNWRKYQMDSTGYERLKKFRNKQNDNGLREDKDKTKIINKNLAVFDENSLPYRLSIYLEKLILQNNPKFKRKNLQQWARDIDLMFRKDNRSEKEISAVIKWCQNDNFWKANILSTKKLREKFDQLQAKMPRT